jgi:predicted short-subunit dehydrogenase-like oxidoreductase (DUF2520 family)
LASTLHNIFITQLFLMAGKPSIAIIGPGRLGAALGLALAEAGFPVEEMVCRNKPTSLRKARELAKKLGAARVTLPQSPLKADLLWLCVPDREISRVARELAGTTLKGKIAFHSSGALASDELRALRKRGMAVASVHPMMTFVGGSVASFRGVPWGLEGDEAALRMARRIARALGGESFVLSKQAKPAYHAWGAFLSPLLVAALVASEQVARAAGLSAAEARKRMMPIVRQTLANYAALGPAGAFSGPLVRGDTEVVRMHLKALKKTPESRRVYLALAQTALRHLPVGRKKQVQRVLST